MAGVFTTVGTNHLTCEDFSYAGSDFAIVADGCSSAKDSDWGSRFIVNTLRLYLLGNSLDDLTLDIFKPLPDLFSAMKLDPLGLCSTFLAVQKQEDHFTVAMMGDGCYFMRDKAGKTYYELVEFETNAPFYPYYGLNAALSELYFKDFEGKVNIEAVSSTVKDCNVVAKCDLKDYTKIKFFRYPVETTEAIFVMTDGIKSFYQIDKTDTYITNRSLSYKEMLPKFTEGKNDSFLKRSCSFEFKKLRKADIHNADDFSIRWVL